MRGKYRAREDVIIIFRPQSVLFFWSDFRVKIFNNETEQNTAGKYNEEFGIEKNVLKNNYT